MKTAPLIAAALAVLATGGGARAADDDQGASPWSLVYQSITTLRFNPVGAITRLQLDLRLRMYQSESPVLADNFVALSFQPLLTPASGRLGVELAVQPLTILRLGIRYEWAGWFGYLQQLRSFPTKDADYSDSALDDTKDAAYATSGSFVNLNALVRMRFGPLALRDTFQAAFARVDLARGDRFFLESILDTLVANRGWTISNDFDLLWLAGPHWTFGVRHTYTWTDARDGAQNDRLGPLVAYTFADDAPSVFERPTLLLLTGWYLEHPYRTDEDVSRAIPYVVLGFIFQGRLL